jgi:hypothetical protein
MKRFAPDLRAARLLNSPLWLACCVLLSLLGLLASNLLPQSQSANKDGTISIPFKYLETGTFSTRIDLGSQEVKFRKEPDFGKNDVIVRQALKVGPGRDDILGFAVNLTSKRLYLDLNRNLDLTDDPNGVYKSFMISSSLGTVSYFRGVRISINTGGVDRQYILEPFYYFDPKSGYVAIRSAYGSEIAIQGQKWRLQVQDNLDGQFDSQDRLLIAPDALKTGQSISYRPIPLPKNLFLEGRQFRMEFRFETAGGNLPVTATITETHSPVADLALEGALIRGLILKGDDRLVIMDAPGHTIAIPADTYRLQGVQLQPSPNAPGLICTVEGSRFPVTAGAANILKVGAPLQSTVAAERNGKMLRMRFLVKGATGEEYSITNPDKSRPPKFVIYRGDRQVASGSFQYG